MKMTKEEILKDQINEFDFYIKESTAQKAMQIYANQQVQEREDQLMREFAPPQSQWIAVEERLKEIERLLKSDSVATLLRYGVKNPSKSGMDDCDDKYYYDLYHISRVLRGLPTAPEVNVKPKK